MLLVPCMHVTTLFCIKWRTVKFKLCEFQMITHYLNLVIICGLSLLLMWFDFPCTVHSHFTFPFLNIPLYLTFCHVLALAFHSKVAFSCNSVACTRFSLPFCNILVWCTLYCTNIMCYQFTEILQQVEEVGGFKSVQLSVCSSIQDAGLHLLILSVATWPFHCLLVEYV